MPPPDYYEILQVSPIAELDIIQAAYKRMALKYHPDRNSDGNAAAKMALINQAYETLRDTAKRSRYDELRKGTSRSRPKDEPVDTADIVVAAMARGDHFVQTKQYQIAIAEYTKVITIAPHLPKAHLNRGAAYARLGRLLDAAVDLTTAIELDPNSRVAYKNRGRVLKALGKPHLAAADFRRIDACPMCGSALLQVQSKAARGEQCSTFPKCSYEIWDAEEMEVYQERTKVYVTPRGKAYHRRECAFLQASRTVLEVDLDWIANGDGRQRFACPTCSPPSS